MQSKAVKRCLNNKNKPNAKRMKLSHKEKELLYINDSDIVRIIELPNVGDKTANEIIKHRNIKPFESEDDLINRIRGVTKQNIKNSNFKLIFVTQVTQQYDKIIKSLINIKLLKKQSMDTLKIIAEFAVGDIKCCDQMCCDNEILILAVHDREKGWWTQKKTEMELLAHPLHYTYHDRGNNTKYYMRNSLKCGNAIYCNNCMNDLRNCDACEKQIYFENDRLTYNVCNGRHYKRGKMCLKCTVCRLHKV
eukprot:246206_1